MDMDMYGWRLLNVTAPVWNFVKMVFSTKKILSHKLYDQTTNPNAHVLTIYININIYRFNRF